MKKISPFVFSLLLLTACSGAVEPDGLLNDLPLEEIEDDLPEVVDEIEVEDQIEVEIGDANINEVSISKTPESSVEYILPYLLEYDLMFDLSYDEVRDAFEEGLAAGEDPLWLASNDPLALADYFGGYVEDADLLKLPELIGEGSVSEYDAEGRLSREFMANQEASYGDTVFSYSYFEYENDVTYVEQWSVMIQSDQLAFPRLVYIYYAGPEDEMNSTLVY